MLRNYLKITLRSLWKRKLYTFINTLGLSVGMASCLLISAYVMKELSYDRFHERSEDIYRITTYLNINGQAYDVATSNASIAEVLKSDVPEIEDVTRIERISAKPVKYKDRVFSEDRILAVDPSFFKVFSFQLLEGDPSSVFKHPRSIILTESTADKLFGGTSGTIMGVVLEIDQEPYSITGICKDPPANSHFHFDYLVPFIYSTDRYSSHWVNINEVRTYVLLKKGYTADRLSEKIFDLFKKYDNEQYKDILSMGVSVTFNVQAMNDVHLYSELMNEFEPSGNIGYVYILIAVVIFIMLLACINFINLSTARSADRAKEVGIRKTVGSSRWALGSQFLIESLALCLLSMGLALGLAELLRYPFEEIAGKNLDLNLLHDYRLWIVILTMTCTTGILAGLYPAWYLTRFSPTTVLKGGGATGMKGQRFRNILVVFQYTVSIILLICTLLVFKQLSYLRNLNLGFNKENVLVLKNAAKLGNDYTPFVKALETRSEVLSVAASDYNPLFPDNTSDVRKKGDEPDQSVMIVSHVVDYNYFETLGIGIKDGRGFSRDIASDTAAVILNQPAADKLGLANPLDALIDYDELPYYKVIGITEDFHFDAPHNPIEPIAIFLKKKDEKLNTIEIRLNSANLSTALTEIEALWKKYSNDVPFVYSFLDEDYDAFFRYEQRLGKLFTGFTMLALLVAGLGIFALSAFMAEQRAKEIGIRKVLGASARQVVLLLNKDFIRLILLSMLIAVPLSYYIVREWLNNFSNRTSISISVFILAGVGVALIAWLTVSYQSIRAALLNPVDTLRDE